MQKVFLTAALALSLCAPVYAAQFNNSGDDIYMNPIESDNSYDSEASNSEVKKTAKVKNKDHKEDKQSAPIYVNADHAEYDSVSGDFHATGNVKLSQGEDTFLTTEVVGNMKTGDVYLHNGGTKIILCMVSGSIIILIIKQVKLEKLQVQARRICTVHHMLLYIQKRL